MKELMRMLKQRLRNGKREQKEFLARRTMVELFADNGKLGRLAKDYGVTGLMKGVCMWWGSRTEQYAGVEISEGSV